MPRRRPRALRAQEPAPRVWAPTPPQPIPGLSLRASRDVRRVERLYPDFHIGLGATSQALHGYRAFLHPPGRRPLYPRESPCPSCPGCAFDDVRHCRDVLDSVLERLPPRSRAELARLLLPLDAEYRRRTLPDPFADRRTWTAHLWWHRRLAEPAGG
ncbi:hypothetical protein [Streptomyces sp. Y1]|uniref:Uncharacterized protein n=1 Tax=Streptomyces sp. Y1 TaxID=3238634 RepID=A0AB39TF10_9ACTN